MSTYFTASDGRLYKEARSKDADLGYCPTCQKVYAGALPWDWRKSRALHQGGTGHKVLMLKRVD